MKRSTVIIVLSVVLGLMMSSCATAPKTASAYALVQPGTLTVCSNLPYPPMEFRDEKDNWAGFDMDLGSEIAKRLGLKVAFVDTVFDTIIPTLLSGKCDMIMSSMSVTESRNKQVSFVPYYVAGISYMVAKGNPENIHGPMDLCGRSVAAQSGTYEVDFLQGSADYEGAGVSDECVKAGKSKVDVVVTQSDSDALQQLLSGKVVAYSADSPVVLYYLKDNSDKFQTAGEIYDSGPYGIAIACGAADCSTAPFSALGKAVNDTFQKMLTDGGYDALLSKWNLQAGTIKK